MKNAACILAGVTITGAVQSGLRKPDNNSGKTVVINEKEKRDPGKRKKKEGRKRRKTSWLTISETS